MAMLISHVQTTDMLERLNEQARAPLDMPLQRRCQFFHVNEQERARREAELKEAEAKAVARDGATEFKDAEQEETEETETETETQDDEEDAARRRHSQEEVTVRYKLNEGETFTSPLLDSSQSYHAGHLVLVAAGEAYVLIMTQELLHDLLSNYQAESVSRKLAGARLAFRTPGDERCANLMEEVVKIKGEAVCRAGEVATHLYILVDHLLQSQ